MGDKVQSRFELLEHTGDSGLEVWSDSPEGILETAALGMFSILVELNTIQPEFQKSIELQSGSREDLLVDWLRELNLISILDEMLFCRFEIQKLKDNSLNAHIFGEPVSKDKHKIFREIKAVTYHDLIFEQRDSGWFARVIFDL